MGLQTKAYLLGLPMMVLSSWAAALGLGDIKLNSTLNQPLDAEIALINVRDLSERELIVSLARKSEFDQAGVELTYFLTDLKFSVDLSSKNAVVRITTREPVREPFLNFIITAQWPSGKLLREYTLLVDLPVFSGAKAQPVQAATKSSKPLVQSEVAKPAIKVSESVKYSGNDTTKIDNNSTRSSYDAEVYGPVSAKDTLWSIAAKVRPDSSFSIQQTMLAIQRINPDAFINNNINLLRRGKVLRVPDAQQINELTTSEAVREVAGQNNTWSSNSPVDSAEMDAQLEGSKKFAETKTDVDEVAGRVKLSSNVTSDSDTAQGTDDGETGGAQIEKSLDVAQEELAAVDREKSDLESRLSAIDEQIDTMEKLVEISNEELRALELAAQQGSQSEELATSEVDATEQTETEAVAEVPEPVVPIQPVVQPEKSIVDVLMDNIIYVVSGVGGLIVLLGGFLFFRSRRDDFDEDFDEELEGFASYDGDVVGDVSQDFNEIDLSEDEDDTEVLNQDDSDVEEPELSAEAETEDVVGECDIHLAYGQYDQAEEKLYRALEKDPANALVRLKLLEVLAAQGDAESFDSHYAKILLLNDEDISSRALSLREGVINISEYDGSKHDTSEFEALIGLHRNEKNLSEDALDFDSDATLVPRDESLSDALGEDETLIAPVKPDLEVPEFNLELDDESELLDGLDSTDDLSSLMVEDLDESTSLDSELGDFDLGDLELDLDESDLSETQSLDDMEDLEFDFDDESDGEELSADFAESLVAETSVPPADESMDFSSLDLSFESDEEDSLDLTLDAEKKEELDDEVESLEFDLSEMEELSSDTDLQVDAELDSELELGDFGDLDDLDAEDDQVEAEAEDLAVSALDEVSDELDLSEVSSLEAEDGDFDVTFNLEENLDLDELDNQLDELAAESSSIESELDGLSDIDLESDAEVLASQPDTEELEEADLDSDLGLSASVDVLGDLQSEAANEIDSDISDLAASAEFDANSAFEIPDFDPENDDDSNLDFLSDNDETATKLDLARAYIDMGDADGAKDILDEILEEGNDGQKKDAQGLLKKLA